jgi:peptidoglycan hydrolase-like protein with peptidoglycan-binding domain
VKAVQRELNLRGYAGEAATGTLDIRTRAAIIAYEFDENMPLTGDPTEALLKSLIFGRAAGKPGPGPADRFEERRELIAQVQENLARMGYTPGPANGRLDPKTRDAIRRFESDRNLGARGHLNERVLLEMVIVAGHPLDANS